MFREGALTVGIRMKETQMIRALRRRSSCRTVTCERGNNRVTSRVEVQLRKTYNIFNWCSPKNILLWTSGILFSLKYSSCIFVAPSKELGSIFIIWFRRRSSLTKLGKRPNKPSDRIRFSSLSLSKLKERGKKIVSFVCFGLLKGRIVKIIILVYFPTGVGRSVGRSTCTYCANHWCQKTGL